MKKTRTRDLTTFAPELGTTIAAGYPFGSRTFDDHLPSGASRNRPFDRSLFGDSADRAVERSTERRTPAFVSANPAGQSALFAPRRHFELRP